jgi:hypothetical protein
MEDRNSPEAMTARATQADPIVMYLVIRESLEMSPGKVAAQCAHASQMLTLKYFHEKSRQAELSTLWGRFKKIVSDFFAKGEMPQEQLAQNLDRATPRPGARSRTGKRCARW